MGAEARLDEFAAALARETGVPFETRVRVGEPADQIARAAESVDADLVVVGPHAHGRGRWSHIGSTAERVIHEARVPTVLATGALGPPKRILAGLNDSAVEAGLLEELARLTKETGAEVTVMHVIDNTADMTYRAIVAPRSENRQTEIEVRAGEWLKMQLAATGLDLDANTLVELGDPAMEILATAQRSGADLILLGTRGAGATARFFIGDVAGMVMRGARCPVWLLPSPS